MHSPQQSAGYGLCENDDVKKEFYFVNSFRKPENHLARPETGDRMAKPETPAEYRRYGNPNSKIFIKKG